MAKGQTRSNREKRKPKADKPKAAATTASPFAQVGSGSGAKGKTGKKAR
jgi:hypothetical protein